MKLGYVILYVSDVSKSVAFYGKAFGLDTRFLHESGQYAELETGETILAFASYAMLKSNLGQKAPNSNRYSAEIALVTEKIETSFTRAVKAGAKMLKKPETKPWGQIVAYVADIDGNLIELCTPV